MNFICEYPNVMRSVFKVQQKIRGVDMYFSDECACRQIYSGLLGERLKNNQIDFR